MKKINFFIFLCFLIISISTKKVDAQLSSGGQPYSLGNQQRLRTTIPIKRTPAIDIVALKKEDAMLYNGKEQPYRFGAEIPVDWSLKNAGEWVQLDNGDRIWRLEIQAKGAVAMNLVYDDFYLPKGAKLYLYNKDRSQILGAFTEANNKSYQRFATSFIFDETTILEYYEPQEVLAQGRIEIGTVIHAYKPPFLDYGDSGACNVNVNCPEWERWSDQKRSVAMIISNGRRHCTGAMINTTTQACNPFMLTANHCFGNPERDLETAMFFFNYESTTCENEDGPTHQVVVGANLLASNEPSDFLLIELSVSPPPDYNVYYAGWSIDVNAVTDTTFCMHHPQGDIKKISVNTQNNLTSNAGPTSFNDTHWRVSEWETGTTERISSGCPLFNKRGQIIGQLHGGEASCNNQDYDVFGKLAYSWNNQDASVGQRIRNFLDPINSGILHIEGRDCQEKLVQVNNDMALAGIRNTSSVVCGASTIQPTVELLNVGDSTINEFTLNYRLNDGAIQRIAVEETLATWQYTHIEIAPFAIELGENEIEVSIESVNGLAFDEVSTNDTIRIIFQVLDIEPVELQLLTDRYAYETSIEIVSAAGERIIEEGGFKNNDTLNIAYCLEPGCYTFFITDNGNDGICCVFGEGGYTLNIGGQEISGGEFSNIDSAFFCVQADYTTAFSPAISADKKSTCIGDVVTLTNTTEIASFVIRWELMNGVGEWLDRNGETAQMVFDELGTYDIQMTVTNGIDTLTTMQRIEIIDGFEVDIEIEHVSDTTNANGQVALVPLGGTAPYTYIWGHSTDTIGILSDLAAGVYDVTITDANGCEADTSFSLIYTSLDNTSAIEQMEVASVASNFGWRIYYPISTSLDEAWVDIIQLNGQKIRSIRLYEGENTFRNLNLLSGIYLYQIRQRQTILLSDRFLYVRD